MYLVELKITERWDNRVLRSIQVQAFENLPLSQFQIPHVLKGPNSSNSKKHKANVESRSNQKYGLRSPVTAENMEICLKLCENERDDG